MHKLRYTPGDPEEGLRAALEGMAGPGPVYVLGLGYVDKADDGAGVLVAETLQKTFPQFSFSEHDGVEGTVLDISERDGPGTVFFVDATDIGSAPGTVLVVPRDDIKETEISTHRVTVALMASVLERGGKRSAVVCVQVKSLEFRGAVSPEVSTASDSLVRAFTGMMRGRNF
ncbi:MAG: hydrogenase maturation protease [Thermoplasmata archaeon]